MSLYRAHVILLELVKKERGTHLSGWGKNWEVGQVLKPLWQLFVVALEHGTCLHYVVQLGNPLVSESFEVHVSSYSSYSKRTYGCCHTLCVVILFRLLQREPLVVITLWRSSHYVWILASLSQCFQVNCCAMQCSREV
jgi:hypothetical protein